MYLIVEQPRGFPKQSNLFLSSFAVIISRSNNQTVLAETARFYQLSAITTQGRLRCPQHSCNELQSHRATGLTLFRTLVSPHKNRKADKAQEQVSTEEGSSFACHCKAPLNLNFQHQPPTGRRKQAPETSSMCPLTDF